MITHEWGILIWLLLTEYLIVILMQKFLISILFLCISYLIVAQSNLSLTSHVVLKGETLYSISKLYHVTVEALEACNKSSLGNDYKLRIGQKLIIPISSAPAVKTEITAPVKPQSAPAPPPAVSTASGSSIHIVQKGETGYSIARAIGLTWTQIREANHLSDDAKLQLGQKLIIPSRNTEVAHIPAPKATIPQPSITKPEPLTILAKQESPPPAIPVEPKAAPATVKVEEPKQIKPEVNSPSPQPVEVAKPVHAASKNETTDITDYSAVFTRYSNSGRKKVVYRGIGMFMQVENPGSQFLALYNYADMGAILKVTNLMSKTTIYVKVIGKVPANDTRNDVILKVSSEAADKLKVSEDKFLVEVAGYIKE